jgi:prepilin-type N-terminal cleavage/methylation domain-containing protein
VIHSTNQKKKAEGFSILELLVVIAIVGVVAALTVPGMVQTYYDLKLRATAGQVADLMQQARIIAARGNFSPGVAIRYRVTNGVQQVYADVNNDGAWNTWTTPRGVQQTEPIVDLFRFYAAAGAPNGGGGAPPSFVDNMDTSTAQPCDNACTLMFSPRGLPCNYVGNVCSTPSPSYFVYYFQDGRPNGKGWCAVLVSKAGRTKILIWNGTSWK